MNKFVGFLMIVFLVIIPPAAMADPIDMIIDGTTEFLIERAKQNHRAIFEKRLQDDNDFKTYFPSTYYYIADGDLEVLLTSREIWNKAVKDDLDKLVTRTFAKSVNKHIDLNKEAIKGMNRYLALVQYLAIDIDGRIYPLNSLPIGADQNVRDIINGFWDGPNSLQKTLIDLGNLLKEYEDAKNVTTTSSADLLKQTKALITAFKKLDKLLNHIETHQKQLRINLNAVNAKCSADPMLFFCKKRDATAVDQLQAALDENKLPIKSVLEKAEKLDRFLREIPQADTMTLKVIMSMRFLKEIDLAGLINIDKLKRHALFFAQLSDVKDKAGVKAILSEYTMPAVSFYVKREKGINHLMLTSYLGYASGKTFDTPDDDNNNDHGIIAPIGLELTHGWSWGDSTSLLLAPIDLGYPVTLKLNGIEEKLSFSDIFAPGVYLTYGIRDLPLNFGIAYQRGRRIAASNDVENRALFFISYDMPLRTLY